MAEEKKKDDRKTKAFYDWATTGIPVMRRVFAELSEIVFQCVGSKESDWWSEICCYHVNFKACHTKSAAVTERTVISH